MVFILHRKKVQLREVEHLETQLACDKTKSRDSTARLSALGEYLPIRALCALVCVHVQAYRMWGRWRSGEIWRWETG